MMKIKQNSILLVSIIFLLITISIFVYFLNVVKNKNRHTSAVLSSLEERILEKQNIDTLEKKMIEIGDTQSKINGYLVSSSNIDFFVDFLENLGANNSVNLSVKSVEVPKAEKNKILVGVNMNGSFPNVMKVINLLENSPYNLNINSLYLNKEIESPKIDATSGKEVVSSGILNWQADVSFSILSL